MPKVILLCGKIGCGKSSYAEMLRAQSPAVLLSCDEITFALFGENLGGKHDETVGRIQGYLFRKSAEIIGAGADVILDWGFWTREQRDFARGFYRNLGAICELHFIEVSDAVWRANLQKRNRQITAGQTGAYYVDDGLAAKSGALFEPPASDEIDVHVHVQKETQKEDMP